ELRLDRVAAASLAASGEPGRDLAALLGSYGDELRERTLIDLAGQYEIALEVVAAGAHPFAGLPVLVIDAAPEALRERELLEGVARRAPAMLQVRLGEAAAPPRSSLASLQQHLFVPEAPPFPPDDTVDVFAASGEALECVEIARRIAAAARAGT